MGQSLSILEITKHVGVMSQNYYMAELEELKASRLLCPTYVSNAREGKFLEPVDRGQVVVKRVRNPKGMPPKVGTSFQNGNSYVCEHRAAWTDIAREDLVVGSSYSISLIEQHVMGGISDLMEGWEAEVMARYRALDVETWTYSSALASAYFADPSNSVVEVSTSTDKWDHADALPLDQIGTALAYLEGKRPGGHAIWIPYTVGYGLMKNDQWVARYGTGVPFHDASGHVDNIMGTPVIWYRGKANLGGTSIVNYLGEDVFIAPMATMGPSFDGHCFRAHWADGDAEIDPPTAPDLQTYRTDGDLTVWVYSDPEPEARTVRLSFSLGMWSEPTVAKNGGSEGVYLFRNVLT